MSRLLALCVGAALLAPAAPALATDFPATTSAELSSALQQASLAPGPDRVVVAAGTYVGPFTYNGTPSNPVEIAGAGVGQTIIRAETAGQNAIAVTGEGSSIHDLSSQAGAANARALSLGNLAVAHDVALSSDPGIGGRGITIGGNAILRRATITGSSSNMTGVVMHGQTGVVEDTTIDTGGQGVNISGAGVRTLRRLRVTSPSSAIVADSGSADIEDVVVRSTGTNGVGIDAANHNNGDTPISLNVRRVTLVGTGGANQIGVRSQGNSPDESATVSVIDSVVHGHGKPYACIVANDGEAALSTVRTHVATTGAVDSCGATLTHFARSEGDPGFTDAAAFDFTPAPGSPLVDAGDPTPALPPGSLDAAGKPRLAAGLGCTPALDRGALEFQRQAPMPATIAGSATATAGEPAAFQATGGCDPQGQPLTFTWSFGDGGSATGASVQHTFADAGDRTVTLTVTDADGNEATSTLAVAVAAAAPLDPGGSGADPAGTGPATGTGSTSGGTGGEAAPSQAQKAGTAPLHSAPGPGTGGTTRADSEAALRAQQAAARPAAAADRLAPRLTKLKLRGKRLRFTLSETAKVTVKVGRRTIRASGRRGRNTIRLRGRGRVTITAVDAAGNRSGKRLRVI